ncbi:MAG TPA: 5-oxoprolinase subunit PxpA [Solirubrobacterales bacterium]|nr:5-oxoprolinase subunit PxpA [Solirubrobacterales bacterium]
MTMDVNCDLGESFGNWRLGADQELLPRITTASLACGFHGGDPVTMRRTARAAVDHGVAVGSHPGLPDLLGFGRRAMAVSPEDLHAYIVYQSGALEAFLRPHGRALNHVKPHGALYPMLNRDEELAVATVDAMYEVMERPVLYWPAGSEERALLRISRARGVRIVREFYPDSRYGPDGETVVERERGPVTADAAEEALRRFLESGEVETTGGGPISLEAESVCVHGDGPMAAAIVARVIEVLEELGRPLLPATVAEAEETPT